MKKHIQIRPFDSVLMRDGRPFDATPGETAHSMSEIIPSVLAGSIRAMLAKKIINREHNLSVFASKQAVSIKKLLVKGPIYMRGDRRFYPMPKDLFGYDDTEKQFHIEALSPVNEYTNSSLDSGFLGTGKLGAHEDSLWTIHVPLNSKEWKESPAYISEERMHDWLVRYEDEVVRANLQHELSIWRMIQRGESGIENLNVMDRVLLDQVKKHYMAPFAVEERTSTAINRDTYAAQDEALYSMRMIVLPHDVTVVAEVNGELGAGLEWPNQLSEVHPMGGKRRLAHFQEVDANSFPTCSDEVIKSLRGAKYIRMILTTPAYFAKGWRPGWLDEKLRTKSEWSDDKGISLTLRWACIPGYLPVSGWSYSNKKEEKDKSKTINDKKQNGVEKAVRRMVPAGSVYFFEVEEGYDAADFARNFWLSSMSDRDRRKGSFDEEDGFGLAIWGTWKPSN
ncbi:type III-B CRISPR module-associated protein Cmr3 [Paenibacillus sp. L3-i20]|uniref:type III-B CRISPR module-associated protein Cmr3 n=1 Tax=Paenibacillus sp. L3-i20 TaxID=2905833 RepID=UPI001EE05AFB|nr:type III-B CRISPR module-associated protein Cmr3 [Paenibacillus sp. L3-i20]GKU76476.1 hypothetical protein L3i20_v208730 [Paenibacillus sp. L3-i20]